MARKLLPRTKLRSESVTIPVSPLEIAAMRAAAVRADVPLSAWARRILMKCLIAPVNGDE